MYQEVTYLDKLNTNPRFNELPSYTNPPPGMGGFGVPQPGPVHSPHRNNDYSNFIRNHSPRGNNIESLSGMGNEHGQNMGVGGYVHSGPGGYHMQQPQPLRENYEKAADTDNYDFGAGEKDNPATSAEEKKKTECSCRDVYDHISGCNICKSFYMEGRNNMVLYIIIVMLFLIIAFLTTKVYDIHLKR